MASELSPKEQAVLDVIAAWIDPYPDRAKMAAIDIVAALDRLDAEPTPCLSVDPGGQPRDSFILCHRNEGHLGMHGNIHHEWPRKDRPCSECGGSGVIPPVDRDGKPWVEWQVPCPLCGTGQGEDR